MEFHYESFFQSKDNKTNNNNDSNNSNENNNNSNDSINSFSSSIWGSLSSIVDTVKQKSEVIINTYVEEIKEDIQELGFNSSSSSSNNSNNNNNNIKEDNSRNDNSNNNNNNSNNSINLFSSPIITNFTKVKDKISTGFNSFIQEYPSMNEDDADLDNDEFDLDSSLVGDSFNYIIPKNNNSNSNNNNNNNNKDNGNKKEINNNSSSNNNNNNNNLITSTSTSTTSTKELNYKIDQNEINHYLKEPTQDGFKEYKQSFNISDHKDKIVNLLTNNIKNVRYHYNYLVPNFINEFEFWSRYFFIEDIKIKYHNLLNQEDDEVNWDEEEEEEEQGQEQIQVKNEQPEELNQQIQVKNEQPHYSNQQEQLQPPTQLEQLHQPTQSEQSQPTQSQEQLNNISIKNENKVETVQLEQPKQQEQILKNNVHNDYKQTPPQQSPQEQSLRKKVGSTGELTDWEIMKSQSSSEENEEWTAWE